MMQVSSFNGSLPQSSPLSKDHDQRYLHQSQLPPPCRHRLPRPPSSNHKGRVSYLVVGVVPTAVVVANAHRAAIFPVGFSTVPDSIIADVEFYGS